MQAVSRRRWRSRCSAWPCSRNWRSACICKDGFWQGGRKPELITPAIYLPTVAPSFVAGTAAAAFGFTQLGMLFFGAGVLSWLAIESIVLHRAAVHEPLPEALRPSLGIQLAPPVVGGVTYLRSARHAGHVRLMLLGYGLYQALMLLRLVPWIRQQAFAPAYWAFSFGVAALPTMAIRMVERGATGPVEWTAPVLFIAANVIIGDSGGEDVGLLVRQADSRHCRYRCPGPHRTSTRRLRVSRRPAEQLQQLATRASETPDASRCIAVATQNPCSATTINAAPTIATTSSISAAGGSRPKVRAIALRAFAPPSVPITAPAAPTTAPSAPTIQPPPNRRAHR